MAVPYLILTDSDSNTYDFHNSFIITGKTANANIQILEGAYATGGKNTGDGFLNSTVITVSGLLSSDTLSGLETAQRNLKRACLKGGTLELSTDVVSRYYDVIFAGITETNSRVQFQGGYGHLDEFHKAISVRFRLENPYLKDSTETDDDNVLAGDDTVSISNGGDFLIRPVITIDADQSVDIPSVTLTNTTDGSMSLTYIDSNFVAGSSVEIDCAAGTVKRDGGNSKEYFAGDYLRLQPGSNSIDYEGAACTLTFTFRKIYL